MQCNALGKPLNNYSTSIALNMKRERDLAGVEAEQDTSNNGGEAEQSMAGLEILRPVAMEGRDPSNCNTMRLLRSGPSSLAFKSKAIFSLSGKPGTEAKLSLLSLRTVDTTRHMHPPSLSRAHVAQQTWQTGNW
jgi:hypothetical protein